MEKWPTVDKKEEFDKSRIVGIVEQVEPWMRTFSRHERQKLDANLGFHLYSGPSVKPHTDNPAADSGLCLPAMQFVFENKE